MKRLHLSILALLSGLAIGYFPLRSGASGDPAEARHPEITPPPRPELPSSSPASHHNLQSLIRQITNRNPFNPDISQQLERLSDSELKELLTPPPETDPAEITALRQITGTITNELYRREGIAALDWAFEMEGVLQQDTLKSLLYPACREAPEQVLPYLKRFMKEHSESARYSLGNYVRLAEEGSAQMGPEVLSAFYNSEFPDLSRRGMPSLPPFPREFDFEKLAALTHNQANLESALKVWASRDPEAARDYLTTLDDPRISTRFLGSLFSGVASSKGDAEAARTTVDTLSHLSPELRSEALKSIQGTNRLSANESLAVLEALPKASDRLAFASDLISPNSPTSTVDAVLSTFTNPSDQTELLLSIASQYRPMIVQGGESTDKALSFFTRAMDHLQLPAEARQQVIDSLHRPAPEQ